MPVHHAVKFNGGLPFLKDLVEAGHRIDKKVPVSDWTALMIAVADGGFEPLKWMLEEVPEAKSILNEKANRKNRLSGYTAVRLAGHYMSTRAKYYGLLLKHGADPSI